MLTKQYLELIEEAAKRLEGTVVKTPLQFSHFLSHKYGADIYLKREDQQQVRSYKIRGAYNKMKSMDKKEQDRGVVCASAGTMLRVSHIHAPH